LKQVTHSPASGGPFAQWTYTYDAVGNLARENDVLTGAFDQYTYDELNRLIAAVVQSPTHGEQLQQFDYDAFGNRVSSNLVKVQSWGIGGRGVGTATTTSSPLLSVIDNQVVNATFTQGDPNLMLNRIPRFTSTGVPTGADYDAQGNLLTIYKQPTSVNPTVITMTYDALGRALTVASTKTGITEKYQYSASGLRTVIEEFSGSTLQKTRVNIYNDLRQLVSQYEKVGAGVVTWKRDILYLGTREAAEYDAQGIHVTMVDHLGTPRIITKSNSVLEAKQKFLPFGEQLELPTPYKPSKGFTNHEQTDSSGLIYMQARFYAPGYGRFSSPDPARDQHFEDTQSWNIYSYVRNNPVMSTDPTGMETLLVYAAKNGADGNDNAEHDVINVTNKDKIKPQPKEVQPNKDTLSKIGDLLSSFVQGVKDAWSSFKKPIVPDAYQPSTQPANPDDPEGSQRNRDSVRKAGDVGAKLAEIPLDAYPGNAAVKGVDAARSVVDALRGDPKAQKKAPKSAAEATKDALKLGLKGRRKTVIEVVDKAASSATTAAESYK